MDFSGYKMLSIYLIFMFSIGSSIGAKIPINIDPVDVAMDENVQPEQKPLMSREDAENMVSPQDSQSDISTNNQFLNDDEADGQVEPIEPSDNMDDKSPGSPLLPPSPNDEMMGQDKDGEDSAAKRDKRWFFDFYFRKPYFDFNYRYPNYNYNYGNGRRFNYNNARYYNNNGWYNNRWNNYRPNNWSNNNWHHHGHHHHGHHHH